jgi:CheY-like chemotaxis protein
MLMESQRNVLVIDDEYYVCKSIQKILATETIKTDMCLNGRDGISKIRERSYDLIIVDVQMPEVNGFEVVRTIREMHPSLPVIITSGFNNPQTKEKAELSGAGDFIPKPFTPDEVLDAVSRAIATPQEIRTDAIAEPAQTPAAAFHRRSESAPPRNMKKAVAYACPIVLDYADDIITIDEQKKKITKFAQKFKLEIVAFYEDENPTDDIMRQPALREIFEKEQEAGVFLCERIWCLSRKRNILRPFLETLDCEGFRLETATTMMDCVSMYARHWNKNKDAPIISGPEAPDYGSCTAPTNGSRSESCPLAHPEI